MNRRDLLKYFGAGTIITTAAVAGPVARIIEPPKVELVKELPDEIDLSQVESISVRFNMKDGSARHRKSIDKWAVRGSVKPGEILDCVFRTGPVSPYSVLAQIHFNL